MTDPISSGVTNFEVITAPGLPYGTAPTGNPKPVVSVDTAVNLMRSFGGSTNDLHNRLDWARPGVNSISYFIPLLSPGTEMNGSKAPDGSVIDTERAAYTQMSAFKVGQAVRAFELWDDLMAFDLNRISSVDTNGLPANPSYQNMIQFYYHTSGTGTAAPTYSITGSDTANSFGGVDKKVWGATVEFQQSDLRSNDDSDINLGQFGFETYLHEIGHTLGLWHPGPYNGTVAADQVYMYQDNVQYTVMSYNRPSQNGLPSNFGNQAVWGNLSASTPMVYDVAAIQAIYGADTNTRTGADVYGFGASFTGGFASQADPYRFTASHGGVFTIYDADGRDRLDGSVFTSDQVIDLNPGAYSSMGRDGGNSGALLTFNVGIAFNTIVEDASGGSGNDQITGNDADNQLNGNDGNDTLSGGLGTNKLYGGFGNDTYILGDGADTIVDPSGYDTVRFTNASTINFQDGFGLGDPSNDVWSENFIDRIEGSNGDDMIILTVAGTGTQDIAGNGGNDILGGNAEFNKIYGGSGNDFLYGRDGWDTLEGGSGNDELNGDAGNDYMTGGTGNDAINGGSGDFDSAVFDDHIGNASLGWTFDLVNRTAVTSYTVGVVLFVNETDTFSGIENLVGSSGNDFFYGHFGTFLNGGDGTDTLFLEATTPLFDFQLALDDRVDLEQGFSERDSVVFSQPPLRQSFGNIEIIHTNVGNDTVVGSTRNDIVYGDEGNDTIGGAAGNDTIIGGAGGDTMDGGIDIDTLSYQGSVTAVAINLLANTAAGGDATGDIISGFENVWGSNGSDKLTGNTLANRLDGDIGNDTLSGGTGADTLNGGVGSDTLIGGIGGDRLDGGIGTDTLSYAGSSVGVTINLLTNTASGGEAAGDIISGFERLIGSDGADKLTGNTLGNILTGGLGRDILTGGLGNDVFDFNAITDSTLGAATRDLIVDFNEAATDRIDLSTFDADALLAGNNAFSFIGAAAFTGLGQARVFQYSGSTYVDINAIGSIAADMRIQLTGLHTLDAADFIL